MASFAQQYNIRLEQEDMPRPDYLKYLVGLNGDTPLGYAVGIRSEKDHKKISKFTNHEKKMRAEWAQFRAQQAKKATGPAQYVGSSSELLSLLKSMARKG